jgi:hypothetical protein
MIRGITEQLFKLKKGEHKKADYLQIKPLGKVSPKPLLFLCFKYLVIWRLSRKGEHKPQGYLRYLQISPLAARVMSAAAVLHWR